MNGQELICFLLYGSFGLILGVMDNVRRKVEISMMPTDLGMYNENGKLVEITLGRNASTVYTGNITFALYTKSNPHDGQNIQSDGATNLTNTNFNATNPTYFIAHGWLDSGNGPTGTLIREAYLGENKEDSNVIVVDWSKYSKTIFYIDAAFKVRKAGREVAKMIKYLYSHRVNPDMITLVGHSLGAHLVGIAGYIIRPQVKHIVGLDPALPMFHFARSGDGLTKKDGQNVQIIHTNAGGLGYLCPHGHSDFFPNSGTKQEGCCDNGTSIIACAACSHNYAYRLFAESLKRTLSAIRCDSRGWFGRNYCEGGPQTAPMGGRDLDLVRPGIYYWSTDFNLPSTKSKSKSIISSGLKLFFTNAACSVNAMIGKFRTFAKETSKLSHLADLP